MNERKKSIAVSISRGPSSNIHDCNLHETVSFANIFDWEAASPMQSSFSFSLSTEVEYFECIIAFCKLLLDYYRCCSRQCCILINCEHLHHNRMKIDKWTSYLEMAQATTEGKREREKGNGEKEGSWCVSVYNMGMLFKSVALRCFHETFERFESDRETSISIII